MRRARAKRVYSRRAPAKRVPLPIQRYVKAAIDTTQESKEWVGSLASYFGAVGTTWVELSVGAPVVGTSHQTRIGNKIRIMSIEIKGVVTGAAGGTALDDAWNVMRVVCHSTTTPLTATPLASNTITINTPINHYTIGTLNKVYYDQYFTFSNGEHSLADDGYVPQLKKINFFKRWKEGLPIEFKGEDVAQPSRLLWVSMISDSALAVHPGAVNGWIRVTWKDA